MKYQQQLDKLRQQIESAFETLDKLGAEIAASDQSSQNSPDTGAMNAVAGYLALGSDIQDDALLAMILRSAMYVVGGSGAGLTLLNPETNTLVFRAAIGDGSDDIIGYEVPLVGSQHGLAFATGEIQSSTPLNKDIEDKTKIKFRNVLVAPLMIDDDCIGTISAVNKQNGEHFTPEDMDAYKHFSELAALVVRQRQREEVLQELIDGKITSPTALSGVGFSEESKRILAIMQDVMMIAKNQDDMLPLCKKLTELLANMSANRKF